MFQSGSGTTSGGLKRCIYIIGPQSTGKTTLVDALAHTLGSEIPVVKEVARRVMQVKGYTREDVDSTNHDRRFSLQRDIFTAQIERENSFILSEKNISFLSDRSAIDPLVYLTHYASINDVCRITSTSDWRNTRSRYADTSKSLIILLLPVDEFLVDDNVRYVSKCYDDWHGLAGAFQGFMRAEKIPFIEIGNDCVKIEERVAVVLDHMEK